MARKGVGRLLRSQNSPGKGFERVSPGMYRQTASKGGQQQASGAMDAAMQGANGALENPKGPNFNVAGSLGDSWAGGQGFNNPKGPSFQPQTNFPGSQGLGGYFSRGPTGPDGRPQMSFPSNGQYQPNPEEGLQYNGGGGNFNESGSRFSPQQAAFINRGVTSGRGYGG